MAINSRIWSRAITNGDWEVMMEFPAAMMHYANTGIFYLKPPDGQEEEYYIWLT